VQAGIARLALAPAVTVRRALVLAGIMVLASELVVITEADLLALE
jgi:hypothetical protein